MKHCCPLPNSFPECLLRPVLIAFFIFGGSSVSVSAQGNGDRAPSNAARIPDWRTRKRWIGNWPTSVLN